MTARTYEGEQAEGLGVGAVDYITKPIDLDETLARVQTQLRFVAINREVVDLQRRLEEARRAATIGAVTQGIAHNLNNLLGVAIGYLDLAKISLDRPDQLKNCVHQVDTALQRIVAIIRQLSTLVVRTQPPLTKTKIEDLLAGAIARFHRDFKLTAPVAVAPPPAGLMLETNTEVVEEMLSKLLMNAWESYDNEPAEPRPIGLSVRLVELPGTGRFAEIRVEDRGRGLPADLRDKIFEPFVSSKATVGVGMGLTVARHALRNFGGEVTLVDREGGGATAIMLHPLERKAPLGDPEAEAFAQGLPL